MNTCDTQQSVPFTKVPVDQLIGSKEIATAFQVAPRTVRRWSHQYGWQKFRLSHKVLRYLRSEVEDSLGVSFEKEEKG
jgi:uncharacterized protein YjcR